MSWAKTAAALALLFMACSPASETWPELTQERAVAGISATDSIHWEAVEPMKHPRSLHTATLLNDGKVLVVAGEASSSFPAPPSSAEVYDPATNTWSLVSSASTYRNEHTATLLNGGKVLIAGGSLDATAATASGEVYDPASNTWTPTGPLGTKRFRHSAALLNNGKVLVAGGLRSVYLSSAEVYDPATNTWAPASPMLSARAYSTVTLLNNGQVLVVGGRNSSTLNSAEVYDPATNTWAPAGSMRTGRSTHTATLLNTGKVLITGGVSEWGDPPLNSAEIYNPVTNAWEPAGAMFISRSGHTATLLNNGQVLVLGGARNSAEEVYDPATDTWSLVSPMSLSRGSHTATLLNTGRVLVAGGGSIGENAEVAVTSTPASNTRLTAAPAHPTSQTAASFSFLTADTTASFECSLDSPDEASFSPCSSPATYASLTEGRHTFRVRARDSLGNLEPTAASYSWAVDQTAPVTSFLVTPPSLTNLTGAHFIFSANEAVSIFQCSLDATPFSGCSSSTNYFSLAEGPHQYRVLARDDAGNLEASPALFLWTVDLTPPITRLITTPPSSTPQTSATFAFNADESGASFECSLDAASFSSCSSPITYADLTEGPHTFQVRARDAAGNLDTTPAAHSWSIDDLTAPDTTLIATPPNPTHQTTVAFAFISNEAGVTFECSLDEGAFSPCASPTAFSALSAGTHTFHVRSRDLSGNLDATAATHSWTVDLMAPDTLISAAPISPTNQATGTFAFTSTEGGSHFECSLDALEEISFSPCSSPVTYTLLAEGPHTFRVRARDAADNLDATAATHSWTIDLTPAGAQLTLAPEALSNQATASFSFTSQAEARFECSLDEAPFSPCVSPMGYSHLSEGPHLFRVRARDAAGNVDEMPEQRLWRVDTLPPETTLASSPEPETRLRVPSFSFSSSEPRSTFECSLDEAPFTDCPEVFPPLEDGPHSLAVRARDEAGNLDSSPIRYEWKVDNVAPEPPYLRAPASGEEFLTVTPLFSGTAEPHSTVTLLIDGTEAGSFPADEQGLWSGVPSSALSWGEHRLSAMATDRADNSSELLPEVPFSTARHGYYSASCSAGPSSWQAPWPWALLLLSLLRRRSRTSVQKTALLAKTAAALGLLFLACSPASDTWPEPVQGRAAAGLASTASMDWQAVAPMNRPRRFHTATLLTDGKVFVTGGLLNETVTSSGAEVYDPATNTWTPTSPMSTARTSHTATLLPDGKVLIAGGNSPNTTSAEVYDPATNTWTPTNPMRQRRSGHTATLLNNGKVLVAGGLGNSGYPGVPELYDPATNTWVLTPSGVAREAHTATLLTNGKVLVTGGHTFSGALNSVSVYDPATNAWTAAGFMLARRYWHTATLLNTGKVLLTGGISASGAPVNSAELYNPVTNTWAPAGTMFSARSRHTAMLLNNGKVLILGGDGGGSAALNTAEVYDPATDTWTLASPMGLRRQEHTATLLNTGRVLVAGGANVANFSRENAEVAATDTTASSTRLTAAPAHPTSQTAASFSFLTADTTASFECSLDSPDEASFSPCSSPATYASLAEGRHTFRVRARDSLGNLDTTAASYSWAVDQTAPVTSFLVTPPNLTNLTGARFLFSANETDCTFQCSLDTFPFGSCYPPADYFLLSEGLHELRVQARDAAGNLEASPLIFRWTIDLTPPATRLITTPPSSTPQTSATFAFNADESGASFECSLDAASFSSCSSPITYADLTEGPHTFQVRARDAAGNLDSSPATFLWTIDLALTTPDASITAAPPSPTNQTTATFAFSANEADATFECSLNDEAFSPCASPAAFSDLTAGTHTFRVRARDPFGNLDATAATYSWAIDLTPAETQLTSAPGAFSNQATASFSFTSESAASFDCSLDEAPFRPCVSPMGYSQLAEGPHLFRVRARDAAGNVDEMPEQRLWRVDTLPPETTLASVPEAETRQRIPSFSFSSEPHSTFECSLDGAPFSDCPEVFPSLEDDLHWLVVRARDEAGNLDSSPVRYEWKVDNVAPEPPSFQAPAPGQKFFTVTPLFSGTAEPYSTVTLLIDGTEAGSFPADEQGLWSGVLPSALSWGEHRLSAMATDRAGNSSALLPELSFSTTRRGSYGAGCSAGPSSWQAPWPWALLLLSLVRRRSRICVQRATLLAKTAAALGLLFLACSPASDTWQEPVQGRAAAGLTATASMDWQAVAPMNWPRYVHTATLLNDGWVFVTGGSTPSRSGETEVYDPASNTWTSTSPMSTPRERHTAMLLPDGKVLIAGGNSGDPIGAEVYDPATNTWTPTGAVGALLGGSFTATLLNDGKVLVTGGNVISALDLAKVYDPATNTWTSAAPMSTPRHSHTATLLPDGKVLIAGGIGPGNRGLNSAEVYDPATNTWTPIGSMLAVRDGHTATLLNNGKVLITGGRTLNSAEIYDPVTNAWEPASAMFVARFRPTATILNNGKVLISGGFNSSDSTSSSLTSVEVYDPATNTWSLASPMGLRRYEHTATLLNTGKVLVAGGSNGTGFARDSAEAMDADTPASLTRITAAPVHPTPQTTASFSFVTTDTSATFECSLDSPDEASFSPCSAPMSYASLPEGRHTFRVRSRDGSGTLEPSAATYSWAIDRTAPVSSFLVTPSNPTNQTTATFTFSANETDISFVCILDGASFTDCTPPKTYIGLTEGPHSFRVQARDAAGNVQTGMTTYPWAIDLTPPVTTLLTTPPGSSPQSTATFAFSANEAGSTFECSLDATSFSSCSSPITYADLTEGPHTFQVRARDAVGNLAATPTACSWSIDLTAPVTSITATPPSVTNQTAATFAFSANEAGSTFECSLDEAAFSSCSSPMNYSSLAEGPHTFRARARDVAGNLDATPESRAWLIDLTAPVTSITTTPPSLTNQTAATFAFSADEAGSTFECSLDSAAFSPCPSPVSYAPLAEGPHTFQVRARDLVGNLDSSPAAHSWTIDVTAPDTTISATPPRLTNQTAGAFAFSAGDTVAAFECSLDDAAFRPCSSPVVFFPLTPGPHTFRVRARDAAGNVDSTPALFAWVIDLIAPETSINGAPTQPNNQTSAIFAFTSSERDSSFECSLDEAAFSPCTSPVTYTLLAEGPHTFRVRARDVLGNLDTTGATHSWTVDLTPADIQLTSAPNTLSSQATASFSFTSEAQARFECSLDEAPFSPCASPMGYSDLSDGPHLFRVRARDAAGNVDETPQQSAWRVDTVRPETSFTSTPEPETRLRVPSFSFSSSEPGSTFECSLDTAPFADCPDVFPSLEDGLHWLFVRARDEAGNLDSTPIRYAWTVDNLAPEPPALQTPTPGQEFSTASPLFSGTAEPRSTVTLLIDGTEMGAFQADDQGRWSGAPSSALSWGEHRLSAMATDRAGNSSALLPEVSFTTTRRGAYGASCAASPSSWQASWPWALLVFALLRRRSHALH